MRLDDLRPSDNVEDRRGGGFGPGLAMGGGGIGIVAVLLLSWFFGIDPSQLLNTIAPADQSSGPSVTQNGAGGPRPDDAAFQFARRIIGSAEDVWTPIVQAKGVQFTPATFTAYDYVTPTGCGNGQASAGPFYCPSDRHIYLDLSFFNELGDRFGAPGEFARAYVVAHEYGHHIQNLLGIMDRFQAGDRGAGSNSVKLELQADCFAGVWAFHANQKFKILQSGDVEGGLKAAASVGDDTLEKERQGYAVPDSFTHGTSEQRTRWFKRGLAGGSVDSCDTFGAASL